MTLAKMRLVPSDPEIKQLYYSWRENLEQTQDINHELVAKW